jgi:Zn-dependent protease
MGGRDRPGHDGQDKARAFRYDTENMTDTAVPTTEPTVPAKPNNLVGAGLLVLWLALGAALQLSPAATGPLTFGFVMLGWILSVMAHEFSHALVGYLAGDHTVKDKGYLAFDPRRYGDLGTSLVIPLLALALGGIGFPGGAVYLRTDLMRTPLGRAAAALAGPGATMVVLLALCLVLVLPALAVLAFLQAMALILNLLPLPGLDGFNAIRPFLPAGLDPAIRKFEVIGMLGLLAVLFFVPGAGAVLFGSALALAQALGLDPTLLQTGWGAFRFWR